MNRKSEQNSRYRKEWKIRRAAFFLNWDEISKILSDLLTERFGRKITAYASSDEPHQREWALYLGGTSKLNNKEMEDILEKIKADDVMNIRNDFGVCDAGKLTSELILKLLNKKWGTFYEKALVDDDGVWFLANEDFGVVYRILIEYPETTCTPDLVEINCMEENQEISTRVGEILREINYLQGKIGEIDRLEKLDLLVKALKHQLDAKVTVCQIAQKENII